MMLNKLSWLIMCMVLVCACAAHEQIQYFEVIDPELGNVNYYRMTIRGYGGLGTDYHMQAGYFSAASVDVLRGQMPNMPEVDLPLEQDAAFEQLVSQYYAALLEQGEKLSALQGSQDVTSSLDDTVLAHARLVWFGQLSPGDVAAMGMNKTTNPFQFRKLVFWAASKNVDLRAFGNEIDSMIANATSLVRARKAEGRRRQARKNGLQQFVQDLVNNNPGLAPYAGLVDALFGEHESDTGGTEPKENGQ
ncbi:MAG: hypothetical protein JXQ75_11980 [Phycisphaerae bacterium]|nr:hypothetical protein [Phycisphaerae bacterium]